MSIESADVRQYDRQINEHKERIKQLAARIAEYSEYLVRDDGDDQWAEVIETAVRALRRRAAIVDELGELHHVFHPQAEA